MELNRINFVNSEYPFDNIYLIILYFFMKQLV